MQKTYSLISLLLLLFATSCTSTKLPGDIYFGSGGGFTGNVTTYTLSPDLNLYKTESIAQKKELLRSISKKELAGIATAFTKMNFKDIAVNTPGNMSQFITIKENGKVYTSIWSGKTSGNESIDKLYSQLIQLLPNKK